MCPCPSPNLQKRQAATVASSGATEAETFPTLWSPSGPSKACWHLGGAPLKTHCSNRDKLSTLLPFLCLALSPVKYCILQVPMSIFCLLLNCNNSGCQKHPAASASGSSGATSKVQVPTAQKKDRYPSSSPGSSSLISAIAGKRKTVHNNGLVGLYLHP